MWFNAIPAYALIMVAMGAPGYALWGIHWLLTPGNHFRRSLNDRWERSQYQRDWRLTGNVYKVAGLDAIPDNPPKEEKIKCP